MNAKKLLATLAVSAVLFSGCGLKSGETIIKVDDHKISQGQFDQIFDKQLSNSMFAKMGIDLKNDKNNFLSLMIKERVVNELIVRTLIDEELAKRKIEVTNADIEQAVKEIVDKVGSKEQLDELLKQNGVSVNDFKKDLKEEVKMRKLAESLGAGDVTETEAKDFYNKNLDKFKYPEKVRASHILISADPAEIEEIIRSDEANKELSHDEVMAKVDQQMNAKKAKAEEILAKAKESAECTHNHPEGIKGAQATALAIMMARHGCDKNEIRSEIEKRFEYDLQFTCEQIRPTYTWGGTCQDSVPQAIVAFLDGEDYEDSIRNAISIGGDSDTIGCITGSIAEAYFGVPADLRNSAMNYLPEEFQSIISEFENKFGNK